MSSLIHSRALAPIASSVLVMAALVAGCERSNNVPPDSGTNRDATIDRADAQADSGSDSGTDAALVDAAPVDAGDSAVTPDGGCEGTGGCWSCAPTINEHFLNGCTTASCQPFPITRERLPALREDGTLPPLD